MGDDTMPDRSDPDHAPEDLDMVGGEEAPEDVEQVDPVKGLLDPDRERHHSPASDADAEPPG